MKSNIINNFKIIIFFSLMSLFLGINIGASVIRERYVKEKQRDVRVVRNCLEVLTSRSQRNKSCRK